MLTLAASLPVVGAAFLASAVEIVEAFTIVLAVSTVRGLKPAVLGTIAALAILAAAVIALGPMLSSIPVHGLQLVIGILLLIFGLGWLRKAVLRSGGAIALHDELAAFAEESAALREQSRTREATADWLAGIAAFKAVLLEGVEVVFIVLAVGARPGLLFPAAMGAAAACVVVMIVGIVLRAPLSRVPENSMKFVVGGILTAFGVYWAAEGIGADWPAGDWTLLWLMGLYLFAGVLMAKGVRGRLKRSTI